MRVAVWREPDLTGEFTVDERGVVVFPLLGERKVTGVSPDSLRTRLEAEYREYLRNPSVDVTLLRRINILGEVRSPGVYQVDGTVTLSEALALAGGVAPSGNANDIRLIRDGETVRQDLDRATTVGSSPIRSGDQIVVGQKSWIARNIPIVSSAIAAAAVLTAALIR